MATAQKLAAPATAIAPDDIIDVVELARRLKLSVHWVYARTRKGVENPIPTLQAGRHLRFDWGEVSAWLRSKPS
jgi:hypothetical protein